MVRRGYPVTLLSLVLFSLGSCVSPDLGDPASSTAPLEFVKNTTPVPPSERGATCWPPNLSGPVHTAPASWDTTTNENLGINPLVDPSCASHTVSIAGVFDANHDYLNADLKQYGTVFLDARDHLCAATAAAKLEELLLIHRYRPPAADDQLAQGPHAPFQRWLSGAAVSIIFGAALQLGGKGLIGPSLAKQLDHVKGQYQAHYAVGCGGTALNRNTCLDDISLAAEGYAMLAAYEHYSGDTVTKAGAARSLIADFFDNGNNCVFDYDTRDCDGSYYSLGPYTNSLIGVYEFATFNHEKNGLYIQNLAYSIGLVTHISAAARVLSAINEGHSSTAINNMRRGAQLILDEAQRHSKTGGDDFLSNCIRHNAIPHDQPGAQIQWCQYCTDDSQATYNYRPKIYPVKQFYLQYLQISPASQVRFRFPAALGGTLVMNAYDFSGFDFTHFSNSHGMMHDGRKVLYGYMGGGWWVDLPTLGAFTCTEGTRRKWASTSGTVAEVAADSPTTHCVGSQTDVRCMHSNGASVQVGDEYGPWLCASFYVEDNPQDQAYLQGVWAECNAGRVGDVLNNKRCSSLGGYHWTAYTDPFDPPSHDS